MAWGHSEDIALDSGGNFSRFFSLSPEVFCVRRRFLLRLFFFPKRFVCVLGKVAFPFWMMASSSGFTFAMQSSSGSRWNFHTIFTKSFRETLWDPRLNLLIFFSRDALMLLTLLFRDYFTLLSRNYDFCRNYSLGLNFTTFPENTLIQFSFFFAAQNMALEMGVSCQRRNRFFIPLAASFSDEKPFSPP